MAELWAIQLLNKLSVSVPSHVSSHTFSSFQLTAHHLQTQRAPLLHQAVINLTASARSALLLTTHFLPGEILHSHQGQSKSFKKPSMTLLPQYFHKVNCIYSLILIVSYSVFQYSTYHSMIYLIIYESVSLTGIEISLKVETISLLSLYPRVNHSAQHIVFMRYSLREKLGF